MATAMNRPAEETAQEMANIPWWRGATIYQVYPRSFADSNDDGIGDLNGITAHLDHIASLGVDGVWVSPFFTSPMRDFGYDVADYCGVDPMFGTLEDFDRLVARAHELGLKVLIDQVYSHTSDQHPWFIESRSSAGNPKSDWYVWHDAKSDGSPPTNWQSVFGGPAWTWDARRGQYYLHNFLKEQPQLHMHNREVQEAIVSVAKFWLDRGVDGFRIDAINFAMHDPQFRDNPPTNRNVVKTRPFDFQDKIFNQGHPDIVKFLEKLAAVVRSYPDRFMVAEVGGDDAEREMKLFTAGDRRLHTAYGFTYLYAPDLTADVVKDAIRAWPETGDVDWPSWAFENHDAPRALSRWSKGRDETAFARLKMMLLASLRGNIFIYYGEELGLPQGEVPFERLVDPEAIANWPQTLGRDGARTPMPWQKDAVQAGFSAAEPWLPVMDTHLPLAVDAQEADQASNLHWTRQMLALREDNAPLKVGDIHLLKTQGELLAFERSYGDETLVCAFNLGDAAVEWDCPAIGEILASSGDVALNQLPPLGCYIARKY